MADTRISRRRKSEDIWISCFGRWDWSSEMTSRFNVRFAEIPHQESDFVSSAFTYSCSFFQELCRKTMLALPAEKAPQ